MSSSFILHPSSFRCHPSFEGKAYLVGAGPGRGDLITVRGLRLLREADVLICDRLIAQELLDEARADAQIVFAGKRSGLHMLSQGEINRVLVTRVQQGKHVVRLKGGDPFVFGRGAEEAAALQAAGLAYEIVPGVSSAIAVPAYAGIPVTHRDRSSAFAVVTGHNCSSNEGERPDWAALAKMPTLVILMGVANAKKYVPELIRAGRAANTPAAVISWGATDRQQVVRTELEKLPEAIVISGIVTPAVIVIGEVAALHDTLDWFAPDGEAAGFIPVPEPVTPARAALV